LFVVSPAIGPTSGPTWRVCLSTLVLAFTP